MRTCILLDGFTKRFDGLTKRPVLAVGAIAFFSLLPSAAFIVAERHQRLGGDGIFYILVAESVAAGKGYTGVTGLPTAVHPPLWTFFVSMVMRSRLFSQPLSAYFAALLLMHGATVLGAVTLAWKLSRRARPMLCAGLSVSLWPGILSAIHQGGSEPCAGAVLALGTALMCLGRKLFWCGVLVLSTLPLVRPNFLVLPVCAAAILILSRPPRWQSFANPARMSIAVLIFYLPSAAWVARNYRSMGVFPLFATEQGSTEYGSYNPVTAAMGSRFAMYIIPRTVLGNLAGSEVEQDRYERELAMQFIRAHWQRVPAIALGHLVRALLPQQWYLAKPMIYPEWISRMGLYVAALLVWVVRKPPALPPWYGLLLGATALTTAVTVIFFLFEQRYLYPLFVLLIPFVASSHPLRMRSGRYQAVSATVSGRA